MYDHLEARPRRVPPLTTTPLSEPPARDIDVDGQRGVSPLQQVINVNSVAVPRADTAKRLELARRGQGLGEALKGQARVDVSRWEMVRS